MATVHEDPVTVQSHPYRPELSLLRIFLAGQGYTEHSREVIVRYAAAEGTPAWCPELEPGDAEGAEIVFCDGMEAVPPCSPAWDEHAMTRAEAPVYIDVESLLEGGRPRPWAPGLTPEEEDALLDAWEIHHNALMDRIEARRPEPEPEPEPYEPTPEDWAEYGNYLDSLDDAQVDALAAELPGLDPEPDDWATAPDSPPIPGRADRIDREARRRWELATMGLDPIAGGSPEPESDPWDGWPRTKTAADRARDQADVIGWYLEHPGK